MSKFKIDDDVVAVLQRSAMTETSVKLSGRDAGMPRDLYERVSKVLVGAGCKWNRSSQSHICSRDPRLLIASAIDTGEAVNVQKQHQQFFTPLAVVEKLLDYAGVNVGCGTDFAVLEPSAGSGNIALAAKARGAWVEGVELDEYWIEPLRKQGLVTHHADFLTMQPGDTVKELYDAVVMNPPFTKGQDVAHVMHALQFLEPHGTLVAIVAPGFTFRTDRKYAAFRERVTVLEELPSGTFSESGTEVRTVIIRATK